MRNLILLFSLFLLTGIWTSCSDNDDDDMLDVSFAKTAYFLPANEPVKIEVTANSAVAENTVVKFGITGSAVKDEDYTLSAEEFVIPAGESSAFIEMTPKDNFTADRDVKLSILSGTNYKIGKNGVTTVTVESKEQLIYSFVQEYYALANEVTVEVEVKAVAGTYGQKEEVHIPFTIGGASTAKEGVNFEIEGGVKEFVIPVGSSKGSIKIKLLNEEEGKDRIILETKDLSERFIPGNFDEAIVKVDGKPMGRMIGKWVFEEELLLNYWKSSYLEWQQAPESDFVNMPVNNTNKDTLEFIAGEVDEMKTILTGDLKNYFRDCEVTYVRDEKERLIEEGGIRPTVVTMSVYHLSKANVTFSAGTVKEKEIEIGFRMIDDNTLEITLYDYEPTDFYQTIYEGMKAVAGEGEIAMRYIQLRYHFTKVK